MTARHALVTGGGSGVGAAVATHLSQQGFTVTITGRRESPLKALASEHQRMAWISADVTSADAMEQAVQAAVEYNGPVDIVVANAGAADSKPFGKLKSADLQAMLDVNLFGVFNTFQAVLPGMAERRWGRLIAIASTAGLQGYGYVSHYCAAKHAVIGMVKALAQEVARKGITANAICPSYVDTDMTARSIANIVKLTDKTEEQALSALVAGNPQGRLVQPQEVAGSVSWLCSEDAAAINGQAIAICGGET